MGKNELEKEKLRQQGYIVLSDILCPKEVEQAKQELEPWFEKDLIARQSCNHRETHFEGPFGYTILTDPSHLALNVYNRSPLFDKLLDKVLSDERVLGLIKAWSGPSFRVSCVNIRYMTGAIDPPPAHELHRDAPGSMNLGIMLTDVEPGDNGATALVPGSQWAPVDPRWDCLFQEPFRLKKAPSRNGLNFFLQKNIFNKIYRKKTFKNLTGAFGKQGDVYFFANGEVWHGRLPNMHGKRALICLVGIGEVNETTIDQPCKIPPAVLRTLPSTLARFLSGPFVLNSRKGTFLEEIYSKRKPLRFLSLPYWAKLERRFIESCSYLALFAYSLIRKSMNLFQKLKPYLHS